MSQPSSPTDSLPARKMSEVMESPLRSLSRRISEPRNSLTPGQRSTEPRSPRRLKPFVEEDYREAFDMFDENKDGKISRQELTKIMKNMYDDTSDEEIDRIMETADTNGDGFLSFDEFTNLLRDFVPRDDSDLIRQAFQLIDLDGTGKINAQKLRRFLASLGAKITDAYVEDVIREIDSNGNGEVAYSDFLRVMKGL